MLRLRRGLHTATVTVVYQWNFFVLIAIMSQAERRVRARMLPPAFILGNETDEHFQQPGSRAIR